MRPRRFTADNLHVRDSIIAGNAGFNEAAAIHRGQPPHYRNYTDLYFLLQ
jgi:hypothetical protein